MCFFTHYGISPCESRLCTNPGSCVHGKAKEKRTCPLILTSFRLTSLTGAHVLSWGQGELGKCHQPEQFRLDSLVSCNAERTCWHQGTNGHQCPRNRDRISIPPRTQKWRVSSFRKTPNLESSGQKCSDTAPKMLPNWPKLGVVRISDFPSG